MCYLPLVSWTCNLFLSPSLSNPIISLRPLQHLSRPYLTIDADFLTRFASLISFLRTVLYPAFRRVILRNWYLCHSSNYKVLCDEYFVWYPLTSLFLFLLPPMSSGFLQDIQLKSSLNLAQRNLPRPHPCFKTLVSAFKNVPHGLMSPRNPLWATPSDFDIFSSINRLYIL